MSSNKFEALNVSDDSDNSDGNIGESANLAGKSTGKHVIDERRVSRNYPRNTKELSAM